MKPSIWTLRRFLRRLAYPIRVRLAAAATVWIGIAAAAIGYLLVQAPVWRYVELKLFDYLVVWTAPGRVDLPITIIGIDEATFKALNGTWPLRRHHATVLDNLTDAGVAVVGFDIPFSDASNPDDDGLFAAALRRSGRTVLAMNESFREDDVTRQWFAVDTHPYFLSAGAVQGLPRLEVDGDTVLRRVPSDGNAFWRVIVREFSEMHPGVSANVLVREDMRIRYVGGPQTFPYVPYHHLLDPQQHLQADWKDFFRDNIVLVGRKSSVIKEVGAGPAEMYHTPFFSRTREFMPRVEVHANLVASMIAGQVLHEVSPEWRDVAWLVAALSGVIFMRRWHPVRSGIVLLLLAGTLLGMQYGALARYGVWIPVAGALMTALLIFAAQGGLAFVTEQRQGREIRDAFSRYVSPALVDEVLAHPDRLELGGERRQLTILFSDLAGFTTISEQHDPQVVADFVNRHLSGMTATIQEHQGTVQKFLGDGVMAFWGAPLADHLQSVRAVQAAIDMQQEVEELAEDISGELGVRVAMRIGINCGECIVGNMGGHNRFDYTAVGDSVNLASRLEGVNKVYGTGILVSEAVVLAVGDAIGFREVDIVRVVGKSISIRIYTPCADHTLRVLSSDALAAYRKCDLDEAEALWRQMLAHHPADPLAPIFLARIEEFRERGMPAPWDGVTVLDSK